MMEAAAWIGPAIIAAVISAVVTGVGWLVSERQAARQDAARRRERIVDVQTALLAEARADLRRLDAIDVRSYAAGIVDQINAADRDGRSFTPFIPAEVPSFIFESLLDDIQVLPTEVIDAVVLYHRQRRAIAHLADDMRGERFERLAAERRVAIYSDYVDLLVFSRELGADVVVKLTGSLSDG